MQVRSPLLVTTTIAIISRFRTPVPRADVLITLISCESEFPDLVIASSPAVELYEVEYE